MGAGFAGVTLARVLGQQGRRVILVDPNSVYPQVFRAEKVEEEQVRLLRKLGLLEHLIPHSGRVSEVHAAYSGRIFKTRPIEQFGLRYADMVNALRAEMPAMVDYQVGRVELITNSSDVQRVKLKQGKELTARLVVLASGVSDELLASLGLRRCVVQRDQSFGFGFDLASAEAQPFDFDALTYYSMDASTRIDYLTLFKFRETMRANLFVFRSPSDPWVREFIQQPDQMLQRFLPRLNRVIGEYRVSSKVESGRVDLYKVDGLSQPGMVMVGDAFQSPCPATGMGLDKVLTDVDVLSECVANWFATPGTSAEKIADFYQHPRKRAMDAQALQRAQDHRRLAIDPSLRWRVHRRLLHLKWRILGAVWASRQFRISVGSVPTSQQRGKSQNLGR